MLSKVTVALVGADSNGFKAYAAILRTRFRVVTFDKKKSAFEKVSNSALLQNFGGESSEKNSDYA